MEIFKSVPNYEGLYEVSNYGRVKSVKFEKETILKYGISSGYRRVNLYKNKIRNHCQVHVLVAMAFYGHKPDGHKLIVHHKDGDKLNNYSDNLEIVTNRKNISEGMKQKYRTSNYTGVSWCKSRKKWTARIYYNGKNLTLGRFDCEKKASESYEAKKIEIS